MARASETGGNVEFEVEGLHDFYELSKRLKAEGKGRLRKRLRNQINKAARPVVGELRTAARGVTVTSARGGTRRPNRDQATGLRSRVASAVRSRPTRRGVRFWVDPSRVDAKYGESLPRYLDGELGRSRRWRHPVFGNTELWVQQTGSPWFFVTIRKHRAGVEAGVKKAMDETIREIQS